MKLWEIIYLAAGCTFFGFIITFLVLYVCQYFSIDISRNWWLVAIPVVLSVILNICLLEMFRRYQKR